MYTLVLASDAMQHTGMSAPFRGRMEGPCGCDAVFSRTISTALPIAFLCVVREGVYAVVSGVRDGTYEP